MTDEELYWRYEDTIKRWEGAAGRLLVANGSIYAIRAELFEPLPSEVADDFVLPLLIAARGYRLVYEPSAIAEEELPIEGIENFLAKSRIVVRGLEAMRRYGREILGSGSIRIGQYLFHKCARWMMGFVLAGALLVSVAGATNPLLAIALAGQLSFYTLGLAAYLLARGGRVPAVLRVPFYFLLVNAAAAKGCWDFARGKKRAMWEKSQTTRRLRVAPGEVQVSVSRSPSKLIRAASILALLAAAGLSAEAAARFTYLIRGQLQELRNSVPEPTNLHSYEVKDDLNDGHWVLQPGATLTLREAIDEERSRGLVDRAQLLAESGKDLGASESEIVLRVNSDGYKGPEIDESYSRPRLLSIGDSSTFGTVIDYYSYPRSLERETTRLGSPVEVVNAGVNRYLPRNVLIRIDEFKALDPDITVLYLGWNALMGERSRVVDLTDRVFSVRAFRMLRARLGEGDHDPFARQLERRSAQKHPNPLSSDVRALDRYTPSFFGDVERIVAEMAASGSQVFVVTIPGLYRLDEEPTAGALSIGHLPRFTRNPFVLAKIANRYNQALRSLGTREDVQVIDVAAWSKDAFHPRHDYFVSATFPSEVGQEWIGKYLARKLKQLGALAPRKVLP